MATLPISSARSLVQLGGSSGISLIAPSTPLTRLNYFDGKFLRAEDLRAEQRYLRRLVELSNQAGGAGVVHGFDLRLAGGDRLAIGPGLAIDPQGRVLLLPQDAELGIAELIERSRQTARAALAEPGAGAGGFAVCERVREAEPTPVVDRSWFLVTIAHAEALCGEEDVYGKLCEEACVTSTDRPYWLEGVVVRVRPLVLARPLRTSRAVALSRVHLRSLIASACYAEEAERIGSLISGAGLRSTVWCAGAAAFGGAEVPLAVLVRDGATTLFLDEWTVRRERMDAPPRRYWQWRMAMRPWDVFLAQVLQFQCQLVEAAARPDETGRPDPCAEERKLLGELAERVREFDGYYRFASTRLERLPEPERRPADGELASFPGGLAQLVALRERLGSIAGRLQAPSSRVLIGHGIVELPPAGYLPVERERPVDTQVRQLLGEGVDLRFCVVRPDYVAHALEAAQHMERISLLDGLDDPERRPEVDVLVPDGALGHAERRELDVFEATASVAVSVPRFFLHRKSFAAVAAPPALESVLKLDGAARVEAEPERAFAFYAGLASEVQAEEAAKKVVDLFASARLAAVDADLLRALSQVERTETDTAETRRTYRYDRDPRFLSGLGNMAREADDFALARRARISRFAEIAAAAPSTRFTPQVIRRQRRAAALWTEAGTQADVFGLGRGEQTEVRVRAVFAMPSSEPTVLDFELRADLVVEQGAGVGGQTVLARLRGLTTIRVVTGSTTSGPTVERVDRPIELRRRAAAPGREAGVEIVLGAAATGAYVVEARWGDEPLDVDLVVDLVRGEERAGLVNAKLTRNPAVLGAGHRARTAAEDAIRVLDASLEDAEEGFAARAVARLFPPRERTEERVVRATRDWVLFHRRRTRTCADDAVPPVAALPRGYALYHRRAKDLPEADAVRRALLEGNEAAIARLELQQFSLAEFAAGVDGLVNAIDPLLQDFRSVKPGNRQLFAAIASGQAAAAEGDELADARLQRLQRALEPVSRIERDVREVIPRLPASLTSAGADGAIVVVTHDVVETTCHQVWLAATVEERLVLLIEDEGFEGALRRGIVVPLGDVRFEAGTERVADPATLSAAKTRWDELAPGNLLGTLLYVPADATGDREAAAQRQATAIQAGVTGHAEERPVRLFRTRHPIPGGCESLGILVARRPDVTHVRFANVRADRIVAPSEGAVEIRFDPDGRLTNPISDRDVERVGAAERRRVRILSLDRADDPRASAVEPGIRDELRRTGLIARSAEVVTERDVSVEERERLRELGITDGIVVLMGE